MPLDFTGANQIYTHPGQEQMQVEVILASRHADIPEEKPLYTVRLRYPRIIHGEIMTHRVFGRNARSSRAVPVKTMLLECTSMPFVPWHWGKNQKGMQADAECNELLQFSNAGGKHFEMTREEAWLSARDAAVVMAKAFMDAGYHKQNINRLLEPFAWIDVLITSNQWDNFLWLRDHKDAEPHLQDLARLVKQALDEAEVAELESGEWHLPYITDDWRAALPFLKRDRVIRSEPSNEEVIRFLMKISAARCARISYKPFDGNGSYEKELERYDLLVNSDRVHASPLEHQAQPDTVDVDSDGEDVWCNPDLHGNLPGWIQARKLIANECHHG